jgi:hypothetical protein
MFMPSENWLRNLALAQQEEDERLRQEEELSAVAQQHMERQQGGGDMSIQNALRDLLSQGMPSSDFTMEPSEEDFMRHENGPMAGRTVKLASAGRVQIPREELGDAVEDYTGRKGRWNKDRSAIVYADGTRRDLREGMNPGKTMAEFNNYFKRQHGTQQLESGNLSMENTRQNMDLNRERVQLMRERLKMQQQRGNGNGGPKAPTGYRWNGDQLEPIPGGPADPRVKAEGRKPDFPSEDERRSAGLAIRMENAVKAAQAMPEAEKPELFPEFIRKLTPIGGDTAANAVTSSKRQQVETAQLDALDAALTLATGAAYTKEQLKNLHKAYFPQIGDSDDTVAAKRARFEDVIKTARIRSGRAEGNIDKVHGGATGGKFKYLGKE